MLLFYPRKWHAGQFPKWDPAPMLKLPKVVTINGAEIIKTRISTFLKLPPNIALQWGYFQLTTFPPSKTNQEGSLGVQVSLHGKSNRPGKAQPFKPPGRASPCYLLIPSFSPSIGPLREGQFFSCCLCLAPSHPHSLSPFLLHGVMAAHNLGRPPMVLQTGPR